MLSVVPITGFLITGGNMRQAWAYSKDWLRVIGILAAVAGVFWLILLPFTS